MEPVSHEHINGFQSGDNSVEYLNVPNIIGLDLSLFVVNDE